MLDIQKLLSSLRSILVLFFEKRGQASVCPLFVLIAFDAVNRRDCGSLLEIRRRLKLGWEVVWEIVSGIVYGNHMKRKLNLNKMKKNDNCT